MSQRRRTNPQICNIFSKLPGIYVAWGSREGEAEAVQITRDQFDHLVLDYYRNVAQHMKDNGWLDFARIVVDEGMDVERILHYCKLMKSDPLTAEINLTACIQGFEYFVHKEDPASASYAFDGLVTYMPQSDEVYNRWEPHHFTDYDIAVKRDQNWNYMVYTNRM